MPKYAIEIDLTITLQVDIEADSGEEAETKTKNLIKEKKDPFGIKPWSYVLEQEIMDVEEITNDDT